MEPRPLIELNVQQAIASILQKTRWWIKWQDENIREKWKSEVEQQFLLKTFEYSLVGWSHGREPIYALHHLLEEPAGSEKYEKLRKWHNEIVTEFKKGDDEEEDDEDEEEDDEDEEDDEGDANVTTKKRKRDDEVSVTSENSINYIAKYLELVAKREELTAITDSCKVAICPAGVDGVWFSDNIISDEIATKFKKKVAVLEIVPDDKKDWHPRSKKQVLDLVHPSLFCCVFGKTLRTSNALDPSSFSTPLEQMNRVMFAGCEVVEKRSDCSTDYQWIPTDVVVEGGKPGYDGGISVRMLSYINNLHPDQHDDLYDSIRNIFVKFVPLFERMLSDEEDGQPRSKFRANMQCHDTSRELPPRPKTLQVVVKIAEIILTPEKPKYKGGVWHIEGTSAENIVGTGIYYFGCENIKGSRLAFRAEVEEPPYQQNDDDGVAEIYGLFSNALLVQELGFVETPEARCVVFPNILQHKVQSFELNDPNLPGVRKILAFFLIDPETPIPSTSVIPPQQQEWMKIPMDFTDVDVVQQKIESMLPRGMSLEEAKIHRLKLMKERSVKELDDDDRGGNPRYFSLCEH
ncbi:hypothetical protein PHPALM_28649 [Phytophthora palmivora]|uniref:DUF4246 domain-containing protein n=1 Tax=Phytophthora palmivora TaxID=4796 RepID=A0A2P4X9I6_9STRA|nr:hypothetical protein PHPALM_28649 [Phytophthora palmivora]